MHRFSFPSPPMASWPGCLPARATDAGRATRKAHVALFTAGNLQLVYAAWGNPNDKISEQPIRVKASIEYPAGNYIPVHFDDEDIYGYVSITAGATATSLKCPVEIPAGKKFFSNTSVIPGPGGSYPLGRDHGAVAFPPPDSCTPDTAGDYTLSPQPNPSRFSEYCYIPIAICGIPSKGNPKPPIVGILGDSIAQGVGSAVIPAIAKEVGIVEQACQDAGIGYLNFGINGFKASALADFLINQTQLDVLAGCSDVVISAGSNDLYFGLGRSTAPHVINNLRQIWSILAACGIRLWQMTIPPKTHSTDGYRTLQDQSPWVSNFGPEVTGGSQWNIVNTYIRSKPAPLAGIIDVAANAATLNGRTTYVWKPGLTSDGTHPISGAGRPDFISLVPVRLFGAES